MTSCGNGFQRPNQHRQCDASSSSPRTLAYRAPLDCVSGMAGAHLPSGQLRELQRAARRLMSDGTLWLVYELPALPFDRRQSASLVFESDSTVRRVRTYPSNWRELADDQLLVLSWAV